MYFTSSHLYHKDEITSVINNVFEISMGITYAMFKRGKGEGGGNFRRFGRSSLSYSGAKRFEGMRHPHFLRSSMAYHLPTDSA